MNRNPSSGAPPPRDGRPDRPGSGRSSSPPPYDPEATRPMPAAEQPGRRSLRRPGESNLPPAPRWARGLEAERRVPLAPPVTPAPPPPVPPAPVSPAAAAPDRGPTPPGATRTVRPGPRGWRRPRRIVAAIVGVLLLAFCAWAVPLAFKLQQVTSDWFVTPPPRAAGLAAFPDWSKQERVNILLMGLDTRIAGDSRADTLILISVDPANKTVAMVSIPRDLWVPIPGFGTNRVNAAYQFGETAKVPGGGAALTMQTVEQDFGVPVHYFAQVDFQGFQRIVDALGGITVDVQHPLIDNEYPADYGYAYQRIYIAAGLQHMNGRTALQYARSRHADSDLARNERQQAVLLALRDEGLQLQILSRLDNVLTQAQGALRTDLSFTQAGSLAKLAQSIPRDQIKQLSIGADMVTQANVDGNDVLLPNWDAIRPAVQQTLGASGVQAEAAAVGVLNGTDTPNLARDTADMLRNAGLTVPAEAVGNPSNGGNGHYPQTYVLDFTGGQKPQTLQKLLGLLKLSAARVRPGDPTARPAGIDFQVMLGDDYTH